MATPPDLAHIHHAELLSTTPEESLRFFVDILGMEIEAQDGGFSKLTVIHDRLENAPKTAASVSGAGWMMVLSGLKSVLETGTGLS